MRCQQTKGRRLGIAWLTVDCDRRTVGSGLAQTKDDLVVGVLIVKEDRHVVYTYTYIHVCVDIAAWSRKTRKFCQQFLRFFEKTTPYSKIFKILFLMFTWRHRSTLLSSNVVKFVRREIGEIERYLVDRERNFGCLSNCRYWAPKICQSTPPAMFSQCSRLHPNRFAFCGVIA